MGVLSPVGITGLSGSYGVLSHLGSSEKVFSLYFFSRRVRSILKIGYGRSRVRIQYCFSMTSIALLDSVFFSLVAEKSFPCPVLPLSPRESSRALWSRNRKQILGPHPCQHSFRL